MIGGSHDGHILTDDQSTSRKGNKDLTHDNVTDIVVLTTEMNHQAGAENHQRQAEIKTRVSEMLRLSNIDTKQRRPETGPDIINLVHISAVRDTEVIDHHAEIEEVEISCRVAEIEHCGEDAGAENGSLLEQVVADRLLAGEEAFPRDEDEEETEADH